MTKILGFTSAPVAVLLVLLTVITMVSGVTTLFTHYFPGVPPSSTMTTTCNFQSPPNPSLVPDPSTVPEGSSGQVSFNCPDANPAFTISNGVFTAYPLFDSQYGCRFVTPYSPPWNFPSDTGAT